MKARYALYVVMAAALGVALVSCGKKETTETAPSAPSAPTARVDLATAGEITGTVTLEGVPPKPRRINMAAEPSCAAEHKTAPTDQEVVVGEGHDLENVIVYIQSGLGNYTFEVPKEPVVLNQDGCMYRPHVLALMAGQTLEVRNDDKVTHNIHPIPKDNPEWNVSQPPGAGPIEKTFSRQEIAIPVKCNVHPWMKAYVAVFKIPYFSVTGKSGSFDLRNVPPGNYTIEAWHEKYGSSEQTVTLGPKETKTINFAFKAAAGD